MKNCRVSFKSIVEILNEEGVTRRVKQWEYASVLFIFNKRKLTLEIMRIPTLQSTTSKGAVLHAYSKP